MNDSKIVVIILFICIYLLRVDILFVDTLKILLLSHTENYHNVDKLSTEIDITANDSEAIINQLFSFDRYMYILKIYDFSKKV